MRNVSIKIKIYLSFFLLVSLFVLNGIFAISYLLKIKQLSSRITNVVDPSVQKLEDLKTMIIESKMYSTNWVFLRTYQSDKDALVRIHDSGYLALRSELSNFSAEWNNVMLQGKLQKVFAGFESVMAAEKQIIGSLTKFTDYDDPVLRLEAEMIVEDQVVPRTASLIRSLDNIIAYWQTVRKKEQASLDDGSKRLRLIIVVLALAIIGIGFLLSVYMARIIISPIHRLRLIVDDLGKGIIRKATDKISSDEIGMMVRSVNGLSENLQKTADFAHEVGIRNFNMPFEPLSEGDTLGKALISMRENLRTMDERLNEAQHIARLGSWEWDMVSNQMFWSDGLFNLFEVDKYVFVPSNDRFIDFISPDDRERANDIICTSLQTREPFAFETRIVSSSKNNKWILAQGKVVVNDKGVPIKMNGIAQDISMRKKAESELELKNKELQLKNKEMEQFAYVASHDLQEPLRTTSSFVNLFHRQYKSKIDENADKYLMYIKQATDRMAVLIQDLLDYSRIGKKQELTQVDCNMVLREIEEDLGTFIAESSALISAGPLPVVEGYSTEIKQLFQNLIINAIKFRKKNEPSRIEIRAEKNGQYWEFQVKDNGIGIDARHSERIFVIFQRLHTRSEYDGSGIGLSHCQKIAELHGGKIWVDSRLGEGSTFHFTIYQNLN